MILIVAGLTCLSFPSSFTVSSVYVTIPAQQAELWAHTFHAHDHTATEIIFIIIKLSSKVSRYATQVSFNKLVLQVLEV
jgi:hypothetical protein